MSSVSSGCLSEHAVVPGVFVYGCRVSGAGMVVALEYLSIASLAAQVRELSLPGAGRGRRTNYPVLTVRVKV